MRIHTVCTVENTKGKQFQVKGYMWHDGVFFVRNPRPDRYPDKKGLVGTKKSRQLSWADGEGNPTDPSKFSLVSMMLKLVKEKKKPLVRAKVKSISAKD